MTDTDRYALYRIGHAVWWALQTKACRDLYREQVNRATHKLTGALVKLERQLPADWVKRTERGEP